MAELVSVLGRPTKNKKISSSVLSDWSQLPEELLDVISENLDNCFDVIHARSVCSPWRSSFPFPYRLIRPSYALPTFPIEKVGLWNLEKIPLFLFRSRAAMSEYFVGGVGKDDPVDYIYRPCPLQCSVKAKITGFDPTFINMVDFQILPLGHQYIIICWNAKGGRTAKRNVAFLPMSKEGGGDEFIVIRSYFETLLVLKSAERKWVRLLNVPEYVCTALVTFRGRFYATFISGHTFVIDPYSLNATSLLKPMPGTLNIDDYIVQSGNDELFLVQKSNPHAVQLTFTVSKLDEKAGKWVEVSDLGDRVLLIGRSLNVCFLAKELPDGCGVSGNSILIIDELRRRTYFFYKYDLNGWKLSSENLVTTLNRSPFWSFRAEC